MGEIRSADRTPATPDLERSAENQRPKTGDWAETKLYRYDGTDLYQWFGRRVEGIRRTPSVFWTACDEPFVIESPRPRTEGRGEEPVAWRYRWRDRRYEDGWDYITNKQRSTFKHLQGDAACQWEIQPLYASPIREPEISRTKRDEIARIIDPMPFDDSAAGWVGMPETRAFRQKEAFRRADAILNLAPVGGRGEEGSSRADLSPASRSPDQNSAGGEG